MFKNTVFRSLAIMLCAGATSLGCGTEPDAEVGADDVVSVTSALSCPSGQRTCHPDTGADFCGQSTWTFEAGTNTTFWGNSAETNSSLSTVRHHAGSWADRVTPSSDPVNYPARILNLLCTTDTSVGTMDVRGKTYGAWVWVPSVAGTSYAGTSCRLRAYNKTFQESNLSSSNWTPIVPGSWHHLSAVFPSTSIEAAIYEIAIDCRLPNNWGFADPTKTWYVDDVTIN